MLDNTINNKRHLLIGVCTYSQIVFKITTPIYFNKDCTIICTIFSHSSSFYIILQNGFYPINFDQNISQIRTEHFKLK